MKKYWFLLILILISITSVFADNITFRINAPQAVVVGARTQIQYVLNGAETQDEPQMPDIKGFDVIFGPSKSVQSSSSVVIQGSQVSSTNNTTIVYTYTLIAKEAGTFTMPAATIKVNGKTYKSNTAQVKVLPPDKNAQQDPGGGSQQLTAPTSADANLSASDIFVRIIPSKVRFKEQEAIVATFRMYSALPIVQFTDAKFPEFEGFITEDFDMRLNQQIDVERYNGRNYYTVNFKKTLLFPQRSGKITIPSGMIEAIIRVPSGRKARTFTGQLVELAVEQQQSFRSSPVTLDVSALPAESKPVNFSGAVGDFSFTPTISAQKVKANDAVTIKLDIKGTGNLKLIKNPEIKFPDEFEAYDAQVNVDAQLSQDGLTGTRTVEYMFIPRLPGKYTIPPIEFSYFDLKSNKYKTILSPEYTLDVAVDPNAGKNISTSYSNQREVKVDQDIRYLKTGSLSFKNPNEFIAGSMSYWLWYIIPLLLFITSLIIYRKQIKANADIALMRTKKANKVATKRLKLAKQYLQSGKKDNFYEEILRAVWGYLSDKLTIPVADLNRENIETELSKYGVGDELTRQFIEILDTGEFARYSPSGSGDAMDNLYNETVDAIGKMENTIKKIK
ncbi:protein BatD [Dysgonomonas sp. 511]|nr:protein BatD [Dysgonomonas sp. 511]